jgi:hypothetical protein
MVWKTGAIRMRKIRSGGARCEGGRAKPSRAKSHETERKRARREPTLARTQTRSRARLIPPTRGRTARRGPNWARRGPGLVRPRRHIGRLESSWRRRGRLRFVRRAGSKVSLPGPSSTGVRALRPGTRPRNRMASRHKSAPSRRVSSLEPTLFWCLVSSLPSDDP